jgi:hypothetical protein
LSAARLANERSSCAAAASGPCFASESLVEAVPGLGVAAFDFAGARGAAFLAAGSALAGGLGALVAWPLVCASALERSTWLGLEAC